MAIVISKLYQTSLIYVPREFIKATGIDATKSTTVEYDEENDRIIIKAITEKEATEAKKVLVAMDEQIHHLRSGQANREAVNKLKEEKELYLTRLTRK